MIAPFIGGAWAGSEKPVAVGERGRLGEHDVPVLGELAVFDAEEVIEPRRAALCGLRCGGCGPMGLAPAIRMSPAT
jgi:hypothetical protein